LAAVAKLIAVGNADGDPEGVSAKREY